MKTAVAGVIALLFLASASFAGADLALSASPGDAVIRAGYPSRVEFAVTNLGPDTATNVKVSAGSNVIVACIVCDLGNIPPGQQRGALVQFTAPLTAGPLTIAALAMSATPDDNLANNIAQQTVTVSTDPDLQLDLGVPSRQALPLPFTLVVRVSNFSFSDAHDVNVTVDLPAEASIVSLPKGCASAAAGRIACHADVVAVGREFSIRLVIPHGSGLVFFRGSVTEAEHDFDPSSNVRTQGMFLDQKFYVTSSANDGAGSLRQAILDADAACALTPCAIAFRIDEPSENPWKTIRVTSPLPAITVDGIRVDGATQGVFFGHNPDGPDIEISGSAGAGDGLTVSSCTPEIANLAVNAFPGNGVSVLPRESVCYTPGGVLRNLFVGTDPTGAAAKPNLRGIATALRSGEPFEIRDCVISGNARSGVFAVGGLLKMTGNRIGLAAHGDDPLPNGNAGVYIGPFAGGSDVGFSYFDFVRTGNAIAFNGQMGVAVAAGITSVSVLGNRIWANGGLGIDIGLDGPSPGGEVPPPSLTLAHYDPAAQQTIVEGDFPLLESQSAFAPSILEFFANGGERPLTSVSYANRGRHFTVAFAGDLTGQVITATGTRVIYGGFSNVVTTGVDQGFQTQTSEFSRPIEVR